MKFLEFLQKVPARKLIDYAPKTLTQDDARKNIGLPFVPVIEEMAQGTLADGSVDTEERFLIESPLSAYQRGAFNRLPYITGFNSHEAMLFLRRKCGAETRCMRYKSIPRQDCNVIPNFWRPSIRILAV